MHYNNVWYNSGGHSKMTKLFIVACGLFISLVTDQDLPSSFISVSSSKHSSTQDGRTICFLFGLLISRIT